MLKTGLMKLEANLDAKRPTQFACLLMDLIFTKDALGICNLSNSKFKGNATKIDEDEKPTLHQEALKALISKNKFLNILL